MIVMFQQIYFKSFCFSKTNPFGIKTDKSTVQSTEWLLFAATVTLNIGNGMSKQQ